MEKKRITFTLTEDDADIEAFLDIVIKKKRGQLIKRAIRFYIIYSRHYVKDLVIKDFMFEKIDDDDIDETFIKIINSIRNKEGISSDLSIEDVLGTVDKIKLNKEGKNKNNIENINEDKQEVVVKKTSYEEHENIVTEKIPELPKTEEPQESPIENDWINDSIGSLLSDLKNV